MRITYLLLLLFWFSPLNSLWAQVFEFDGNDEYTVYIDSVNNINDWQIGMPMKQTIFGSRSQPNCIVTHLDSAYTPSNVSIFTIRADEYVTWSDHPYVVLEFDHIMDTDVGKDGGVIEISYNSDTSWINIFQDTFNRILVTNLDTVSLPNGEIAISTQTSGWERGIICWNDMVPVDSLFLRVKWVSDSVDNRSDGWAIDNILLMSTIVDNVEDEIESPIYLFPNPSNGVITLSEEFNGIFSIYNTHGDVVKNGQWSGHQRDISDLPSGIYYIMIGNHTGQICVPFVKSH